MKTTTDTLYSYSKEELIWAYTDSIAKRQTLIKEKAQLKTILTMIINDLPYSRDWLCPQLEKDARELIK